MLVPPQLPSGESALFEIREMNVLSLTSDAATCSWMKTRKHRTMRFILRNEIRSLIPDPKGEIKRV